MNCGLGDNIVARLISRAENWERVYTAFANINFASFDYNTVKQSILDYIKLYFPETFNDFIESSELIAIVESFCYIAELLAYRFDVTAHENFISTAQRRDSILKLAKLISYKPSRPLPARGLVKITSVSTTETLIDSSGNSLATKVIRWNDSTNSNWKDQFLLVLNRVLDQEFGTVSASDRFQMQDVLFEIYPLITTINTLPYTASVYGQSVAMELVPVTTATGDIYTGTVSGFVERRPQDLAQFSIMYGTDGMGDASDSTGFFCYTKQGSLQRFTTTFDGITPNQTYDVSVSNINDTDVWVNNIDPTTKELIIKTTTLPYRVETTSGKYGEWVEVDVAHAQNVIFNTNPKRNKYELETIANNGIRILFGDGEFADIPQGTFDIWARTSVDDNLVVPQTSVVDVPLKFTYTDTFNQVQTFTFTVSLISSLQNASAAETTEHVRDTAPAVYYTQDRMVNDVDYNVYLRQNPSVLKLRAVNRTFAGDSKYITWHDSSNTYENVKIFGTDGIIEVVDSLIGLTTPTVDVSTLISTYIEPLLASTDVYLQLATRGVDHSVIRRVFNNDETARLVTSLTPPPSLRSIDVYYNLLNNQWYPVKTTNVPSQKLVFGGYQVVDVGGYAALTSTPITYIASGTATAPYSASFNIEYYNNTSQQTETVSVGISTSTVPTTVGELLNLLNTQLSMYSVVASISGGNIVLSVAENTSNSVSTPQLSTIKITEPQTGGRLFSDMYIVSSVTTTLDTPVSGYAYPTNFITTPLLEIRQISERDTSYTVSRVARRFVFQSQTTGFWNTNNANRVIDYDSLDSSYDTIGILQANPNCNRSSILQQTWNYNILGQEFIQSGTNLGLVDEHSLSIMPVDVNGDNVPDYVNISDASSYAGIADIVMPKLKVTITGDTTIALPVDYIVGFGDITITATTQSGVPVVLSSSSFALPTTGSITSSNFGIQTAPTTTGWYETDSTGLPLVYGAVGTSVRIVNVTQPLILTIYVKEYVYYNRTTTSDDWIPVDRTAENFTNYVTDYTTYYYKTLLSGDIDNADLTTQQQYELLRTWKRVEGRDNLNFVWFHYSPRYHLVDPSPTNIIDMFIITRGYFTSLKRWLEDSLATAPDPVTPVSLRNDYGKLLDNKMSSDTVVLHPGKIKLLFGSKSIPALQARFKVIKSSTGTMTTTQIKSTMVATIRNFFDITSFEFGETFYFTELATAIHMDLISEISSVVLVPTLANSQFGDLLQVSAREDEVFYPDISVDDIDIIEGFTATNLRLNG